MPAPFLIQIQQHAAPFLRDALHRRLELRAAIAADRMQHVAGQALRVDADEHVLAVADVAADQRHVRLPSILFSNAWTWNSPCSVGSSADATRFTSDSVRIRYRMRSAIVIISRPCLLRELRQLGTRAIVPSSFMISQMTPAGYSPAMRARSTAASVWPARTSTPPVRARSGNMWPGRRGRRACVAGSIAAQHGGGPIGRRNAGRRAALRLDRHAERVSNREVFWAPSAGFRARRAARRHRQADQAAAVLAMKLMASGVTFSAAIVRSPFVLPILVVDDDDHLAVREWPRRRPRCAQTDFGFLAPLAIFIGLGFELQALACPSVY